MPKKTIKTLYKELLIIEDEIKETYELFSKRDELLKEIYDKSKGPQEIKYDNVLRLVEVVEQKGHYVYNKPLRLSNKWKKAA